MRNGYEPRFDLDYAVGRQAELWVGDIREALKSGSVEVKRDREALRTGNVYVEYQCKRQGEYRESGIATSTAQVWIFVLKEDELAIIVSKERLVELAREAYKNPANQRECRDGSHPTKGVVVKVRHLLGVGD